MGAVPVVAESSDGGVPAVEASHTGPAGVAVKADSVSGPAVRAHGTSGRGVWASSDTDYGVRAASKTSAGLRASSEESDGIQSSSTKGQGVAGSSETGHGVTGTSNGGAGVVGRSDTGNGGWFESDHGEGVRGWSKNPDHGAVVGINTGGGNGGYFESNTHEAIHAVTNSTTTAAIAAYQANPASNTAALYAKTAGTGLAAHFDGTAFAWDFVSNNGDCAEEFDIAADASAEPGTVMVLGDNAELRQCASPYDTRVTGVISGAGDYQPGLILDKQPDRENRKPVALMGKVFCKVDAEFGPIAVGDLLTTSPTPGCAMRVDDPTKAHGAILGKALRSFGRGQGLIPILVTLQ